MTESSDKIVKIVCHIFNILNVFKKQICDFTLSGL